VVFSRRGPGLLAAPDFPWAGGSWSRVLRPEVAAQVRLEDRAAQRYADAQAEVPRLLGEAVGLEVRVPFCDVNAWLTEYEVALV
jgi:hypothetical protein